MSNQVIGSWSNTEKKILILIHFQHKILTWLGDLLKNKFLNINFIF